MAPERRQLLRQIRRMVVGQDPDTDAVLLDRFVQRHDDDAFAELVRRHGAMVLGVCRRVLHDEHKAEEACQASFFVLARQASRIRSGTSLASWLHSVARRLALQGRQEEERRRRREVGRVQATIAPVQRGPLDELTARELLRVLDEELQRLPEVYRASLILCVWEGHTTEEAARRLGCSSGSVRGRLVRGRARLHARLVQRGLTLGTGLLALGALQGSTAGLSPELTGATVRSALLFAAGCDAIGASVSCKATVLAEGVMRAMLMTKIKIGMVLLGLTLCLGGSGVLAYRSLAVSAAESPQPADEPKGKAGEPHQPGSDGGVTVRVDLEGDPLPEGVLARLGTRRLRHPGRVHSVAFSPDGKTVASAGQEDGTVCLWEVATGKEIRTLKGYQEGDGIVWSVAFSSDGKTVAGGQNGTVRLWEAATGKEVRILRGHKGSPVTNMAFSSDGQTMATGDAGGKIRLWNTATGKEIPIPFINPGFNEVLAFSSDGKMVASGGGGGAVCLWEVATGKEIRTLQAHEGPILGVAFSPDGKTVTSVGREDNVACLWEVVTGKEIRTLRGHKGRGVTFCWTDGKIVASTGLDGTLHLWEAATGKEIHILRGHQGPAVAVSPDGKTVVSRGIGEGVLRLWEAATGKEIRTLRGHQGGVRSVAFSSDGKTVVSAGGPDGTVRLWEVATGKEVRILRGHKGSVMSVAFSSDGKTVASGGDNTVRLWEAATGKEIRTLKGYQEGDGIVWSVAFSSDGKTVASGERDNTVRLWEVATGKEIRTLQGHQKQVLGVAFSSDGKTVASGRPEDDTVKEIRTLQGYQKRVLGVAFSSDGKTVASGGEDGTVRLWEVTTGKEIRTLQGHQGPVWSVAFSSDGKMVASGGGDGTMRLWEVATGTAIQTLQGRQGVISSVAFAPNGRTVAAPSGNQVLLWDLPSGDQLPPLVGHRGNVSCVTFSPDGRALASVSADTTGLIWDLTFGATRPTTKLDANALHALWADLASTDVVRGRRAKGALVAAPAESVSLLRERLQPVPAETGKRLAQLVADFDADDFQVRQSAYGKLAKYGADAKPALRKGLEGSPPPEVRKRLEELLKSVPATYSGEVLRGLRAVEVLERIGTSEARQVLKTLAAGAPGFRLTQEAQAALERLKRARQR